MQALANLPDDVFVEIVVRLPAQSIARCRAVCRAWCSVISNTNFDIAYAKRPASIATVTANYQGFEFHTDYCYAVDEGTRPTLLSRSSVVLDFFLRWRRAPPCTPMVHLMSVSFSSCSTTVRGSWDGVLCIERGFWEPMPLAYRVEKYVLWNPVTKACATVYPPADRGKVIGAYAHPTTRAFHLVHGFGKTTLNDHLLAPTTFWIVRVGDATTWREVPLEEEDDDQPSNIFISNNHNARCVKFRGNLHWLALSGSGALRLLVFNTSSQDRFRWMEAPPELRRGPADLTKARLGTVSGGGGKLCIFVVEPSMKSMDVWLLDDYVQRSSWRLKDRISLVDLSWRFNAGTEVEVVEGVGDGEEIFLHSEARIDVYNVGCKTWRRAMYPSGMITVGSHVSLVMHRESAVQHEVGFGQASQAVSRKVGIDGKHRYNLP